MYGSSLVNHSKNGHTNLGIMELEITKLRNFIPHTNRRYLKIAHIIILSRKNILFQCNSLKLL